MAITSHRLVPAAPAVPVALRSRAAHGRRSRLLLSALVLATVGATVGVPVWAGPARADDLPLTRVVLSSAGLGQFLHEGEVAAGHGVDLSVRLDQVDDVLKSLTVFDALGAVGPVSLPGREPLDELFRDLPFDRDALASPSELLNALVGAEIEIAGPVAARGRVFRVEEEKTEAPDGRTTATRHRLTLVTDKGFVQAVLEDVTALSFTDAKARGDIDRALAGLAENRAKDRRTLSISVLGQGTRRLAVAYVVAAPIWKTTWRLVVPEKDGRARLQGWAVLENLTGGDWRDVDLTLVSGNPVTLTQPLYASLYGERVEVPVATGPRIAPPSDSGRVGVERLRKQAVGAAREEEADAAVNAKAAAPMPQMALAAAPAPRGGAMPPPPPMAAPAGAAAAEEAATQLLYRFPQKVSLATGHTMMLPFVDREIAAERVWVYRPTTDAHHPLAALRLVNDGDTALPTGIVTAFETRDGGLLDHVGDAVLPLTGKGEAKFVSFALDAKTDVRREDRGVRRTTLGTIAGGKLTLTVKSRRTFAYEITAPADQDRTVVIEEARLEGWTPTSTEGIEVTPSHWRERVSAAKGATTRAEFAMERTDVQTVMLGELTAEDVFVRIRGLENEGPAFQDAVKKLADVVADLDRFKGQRVRNDQERDRIVADQERVRANLQSVGNSGDLGRRYVDTLRTQENRLAELTRIDQTLEDGIAARRRDAAEIVKGLKL